MTCVEDEMLGLVEAPMRNLYHSDSNIGYSLCSSRLETLVSIRGDSQDAADIDHFYKHNSVE